MTSRTDQADQDVPSEAGTPGSGFLISLEGIEGSGKSTQCPYIADWCQTRGWDVVISREPGGTAIGQHIRRILLSEEGLGLHEEAELLLLFADRCQHYHEVIHPALQAGKMVITDRFSDASFAYQGAGRGVEMGRIQQLLEWTLGDFRPHLTLLFDVPPDAGLHRATAHDAPDRFEREPEAFHAAVRQAYQDMAQREPQRFRQLDARHSQAQVRGQLRTVLQDVLGAR